MLLPVPDRPDQQEFSICWRMYPTTAHSTKDQINDEKSIFNVYNKVDPNLVFNFLKMSACSKDGFLGACTTYFNKQNTAYSKVPNLIHRWYHMCLTFEQKVPGIGNYVGFINGEKFGEISTPIVQGSEWRKDTQMTFGCSPTCLTWGCTPNCAVSITLTISASNFADLIDKSLDRDPCRRASVYAGYFFRRGSGVHQV